MLNLLSNHRDMRDMYIYIYIKRERERQYNSNPEKDDEQLIDGFKFNW